MNPPYPPEVVERCNAELAIVFETLDNLPFPEGDVEAIYEQQARRVMAKHGLEGFSYERKYVYKADPDDIN